MRFGLIFFSSYGSDSSIAQAGLYDFMLDVARFADSRGYGAIWTPERHFHAFGGGFANPAITTAALAMVTKNLQLRAGSLVSPLHDELRVAEDWSMLDNLSNGRVGISFGAGWNANDFVLRVDAYANRQDRMFDQIGIIRNLWRGKTVKRRNPFNAEVELQLYPRPLQSELPVWVTSSGRLETFRRAGAIGANVLTHLTMNNLADLEKRIAVYRAARQECGHSPGSGIVSLMLHCHLGISEESVRATVKPAMCQYLKSAMSLEQAAAMAGGTISGGLRMPARVIPQSVLDEMAEISFTKYFEHASLMGTVDKCDRLVGRLESIGVDEIACLFDFGLNTEVIWEGLDRLTEWSLNRQSKQVDAASRE
jgi:natural product biosynthesis luciferase-like monooxygenase protein